MFDTLTTTQKRWVASRYRRAIADGDRAGAPDRSRGRERTPTSRDQRPPRGRSRAARSEQRQRGILDHVPIGVVFPDQARISMPTRACEMLGRSEDEMLG